MKIRKCFIAAILCAALLSVLCAMAVSAQQREEPYSKSDLFESLLGVAAIRENIDFPSNVKMGNGVSIEANGQSKVVSVRSKNVYSVDTLTREDVFFDYQVVSKGANSLLQSVRLRLIDEHDANNFIAALMIPAVQDDGVYYPTSYIRGEYGSFSKGLSNETGQEGKIWQDYYGTTLYNASFATYLYEGLTSFRINFDYAEKILYCNDCFVMDFDDPLFVDDMPWSGFTSGSFRVEIELSFASVPAGGIIVSQFAGHSLSGTFTESDKVAPAIALQKNEHFNDVTPDGVVGYGYELPIAFSSDWYQGKLAVDLKVYQLDGNTETDVSHVLSGGVFLPECAGEYVARYSTQTIFGKSCLEELSFTVVGDLPQYYISFERQIESPEILSLFEIPQVRSVGGVGKLTIEESLRYNGKEIDLDMSRRIFIDQAGYLVYNVSVRDFLGENFTKSYYFEVDDTLEKLVFSDEMPLSVLAGEEIVLPDFSLYGAEADAPGMRRSILADGKPINLQTRKLSVEKPAGSVIEVRYCAEYAGKSDERVFRLNVIGNQTLNEFFCVEEGDVSIVSEAEGVRLQSDGAFTVAMPFEVAGLDLGLNLSIPRSGFGKLMIRFENEYNILTLEIRKKTARISELLVDGGKTYYLNGAFGSSENGFRFTIDVKNGLIRYPDSTVAASFEPWQRDYAGKLSFSAREIYGEAELVLTQVGNQSLRQNAYLRGDMVNPEIIVYGEFGYIDALERGAYIDIYRAAAYDVLSSPVSLSVSVIHEGKDGSSVLYEGNAANDYRIQLCEYGTYTVRYRAGDSSGNEKTTNYRVQVKDTVAPEYTFLEIIKQSYKKGETFILPNVEGCDNYSSCTVEYYIIELDTMNRTYVSKKTPYVLTETGLYRLVIVLRDEDYNTNIRTYDFAVV